VSGGLAETFASGSFWYPFTFGCLAGAVLVSALLVVLSRNIVHSALWLLVCLLGVAGLFILLNAEFLAGIQVLIYCGGIVVLMLFALMLTRDVGDATARAYNRQLGWGLAAVLALGLVGARLVGRGVWMEAAGGPAADVTGRLSEALLGPYVAAFEIASVVLLVATIGAIVIARGDAQ